MGWKKEITGMCVAFAKAEDQSLTSEERKDHREEYLRIRTNLLCELQLLHDVWEGELEHFVVTRKVHEEDV